MIDKKTAQELIEAVNALTAALNAVTSDISNDTKAIIESIAEPVKEIKTTVATYETLRLTFLKVIRADATKKEVMRDLLTKYGAKKVTEVKVSDLPKILAEIKALS